MHDLGRLVSVTATYALCIALLKRVLTFIAQRYLAKVPCKTKVHHAVPTTTIALQESIRPLHAFDYKIVPPVKYRPFETKRHVAMGITKSAKEDWIRIDQGYLDRINIRRQLLESTPEVCMGNSERSNPAIRELYEEILLDLLPKRYPTIYRITGDLFCNLVTGSRHHIPTALSDHRAMLRRLIENVEEDFWFMVPCEHGEFKLQGFAACFPQGLLPAAKVGMTVSEIHAPIPGYDGRLKKGVNRCFERMERGQSVARVNWSIQCNHSILHLPYDGANTIKAKDSPSQDVGFDPLSSYLRVEHHTLTCLLKTGTIVFAVRSYLTPLAEIKAEGSGPTLAEACESMPENFAVYKNRPTWGAKLCAWLREADLSSQVHENVQHQPKIASPTCPYAARSESQGNCPFVP